MGSFDERFAALHRVAFQAAFTLLGDRAESQDLAQETRRRWRARSRLPLGQEVGA